MLAYVLAVALLGDEVPPLLAPLTALLVAQLTIFETVKSSVERVGSVVAGVLVAVALSNFVGLTWWSLGIVIFAALVIGTILRLGDHTLEVPISAMLVLAVAGQTGTAALGRVVETLIGAVTGVVVSFLLRPPMYVQPAGDAIGALAAEMAELLSSMGEELTEGWSGERARAWEDRARELDRPLRAARVALARGEESLRLNPRQRRVREGASSLRAALAALEHAAVQVRGSPSTWPTWPRRWRPPARPSRSCWSPWGGCWSSWAAGWPPSASWSPPRSPGRRAEAVPLHIALEIARTHRDVLAELMLVDARTDLELWHIQGACWPTSTGCCARSTWSEALTPACSPPLTCDTTRGGRRLGRPGRSGWMDVHLITDDGLHQCPRRTCPPSSSAGPGGLGRHPPGRPGGRRVLAEVFGFHPLAIQDCENRNQVPKVHVYARRRVPWLCTRPSWARAATSTTSSSTSSSGPATWSRSTGPPRPGGHPRDFSSSARPTRSASGSRRGGCAPPGPSSCRTPSSRP